MTLPATERSRDQGKGANEERAKHALKRPAFTVKLSLILEELLSAHFPCLSSSIRHFLISSFARS